MKNKANVKIIRHGYFLQNLCSLSRLLSLACCAAFGLTVSFAAAPNTSPFEIQRHSVPQKHPYLLGSADDLRQLTINRPAEYARMKSVALSQTADFYSKIISAGIVSVIENNPELASQVQKLAMRYINGPIRKGHVPFATDLALCGIAFDLCNSAWSPQDRARLIEYYNNTVDANVTSEPHVFHNGWYGYKNWGIGVAGYATYHENPRSPAILRELEEEYCKRAAPALALAGNGGGWAEGYYIHYWLYEWLFFCEMARTCEGVDYYAAAPAFYGSRAVASMFETYPGISEYGSRRMIPMGDGGGRRFGGDRDKALAARRILVNYFRENPRHQAVHSFNETTPRSSVGNYAYKDFLWHDVTVMKGRLADAQLSHVSTGPGYVYARSSWDENATYFFFKCGDRFTAHQHLDVNHFLIYKNAELAGDGGHYDEFGTLHDVNYHLRSIAHNTILVHDPGERWRKDIRAGISTSNDGGQKYPWRHHNGASADVANWKSQQSEFDIAHLLAFQDFGDCLYVAGDGTGAYSSNKLSMFTRQIVFIRPDIFVIFDRVKSTKPEFKITWLLQAMNVPERLGQYLVVTNGQGSLYLQTLMPVNPDIRLVSGKELYRIGEHDYPPKQDTGPAPACRIEISPSQPRTEDFFLHCIIVPQSISNVIPELTMTQEGSSIRIKIGSAEIQFETNSFEGDISCNNRTYTFSNRILTSNSLGRSN